MKGLNPILFGPHIWRFLHELPWLFPKEILAVSDQVTVIRFINHIVRLLPCMTCRDDATGFLSSYGIKGMFYETKSGSKVMTRKTLAKWIWDFHNIVNKKLGKPSFGLDWTDSLDQKRDFKTSLCTSLLSISFAISYNTEFDETDEQNLFLYKELFLAIMPKLFRWKTNLNKFYIYHLKTKTIPQDYKQWFYWIYEFVHFIAPQDYNSFGSIESYFLAFQSKQDCNLPNLNAETGTIFQGCQ